MRKSQEFSLLFESELRSLSEVSEQAGKCTCAEFWVSRLKVQLGVMGIQKVYETKGLEWTAERPMD